MVRARRPVSALAMLVLATAVVGAQPAVADRPQVLVAELDGIIHPIAVEYLTGVIDQADASPCELIVFVLRTPGGLLDSTRAIVSRMIAARVPVAVYVGPSGSRAASAGFVITLAADVAAMAPGTHIGAAHPVSGTGDKMDDTMAKKAASDAAAYVRSLAEARRRNVRLAEQAVLESRAFTASEAAGAAPPLVDVVASSLEDLLGQLDGRSIRRFDGRSVVLHTGGATVRRVGMSWRQRFLGAIAHPQVAYLLLTLGMLGLTVELWNPGAVFPGVAGGLCLLVAFFALQVIPVNTTGLLLVLFGLALIVLELKLPSFGALGIGGTISVLIGSLMATREVPGVHVGPGTIIPAVALLAGSVLLLGRLALAAQRQPSVTGAEALVGQVAQVRSVLSRGRPGMVSIHGELWQATSELPTEAGDLVRVTAVNGLTLIVVPDSPLTSGELACKA